MLGRKYDDPFIQKRKEKWPFKIEEEKNSININIAVDKKQKIYYPYQISGLIFKNLIEVSNLKSEVNKSKIIFSIPSLSNRETINEIIKATDSVDLHVSCFITEPILALFAYLYRTEIDFSKGKNVILMYSLGASFLDVSLIEIDNGHFQITTKRDDEVYGQQFDDNVFEYVESEMIKKYSEKKDFLKQNKIQAKLHKSVEDAKIYLSEHDTADIIIEDESLEEDDDNKENSLKFTLTIEKFNEINQLILEKSTKLVESMISEIKEQIDHLFLVGGSTYIKRIRELLNEKTGKEATQNVDPREAVALGSCIAGAHIFHLNMENTVNNNSKLIEKIISQLKVSLKFNFFICLVFLEDLSQIVFDNEDEFQEKTVCLKTKCKIVSIFRVNKDGEKNYICSVMLKNPVNGNINVSLKTVEKNSDFLTNVIIGSNYIDLDVKICRVYEQVQSTSSKIDEQSLNGTSPSFSAYQNGNLTNIPADDHAIDQNIGKISNISMLSDSFSSESYHQIELNDKLKSQKIESEEKSQLQQKKFDQKLQDQKRESEKKLQLQKKKFDQELKKQIDESNEKYQKLLDQNKKLEAEINEMKKSSQDEQFSSNHNLNILNIDDIHDLKKMEKIYFTKKLYALQIINTKKDTEDVRSFLKKYETLNLVHPSIVKIYGIFYGNETTPPSILIEYCPKTLDELIKERKTSLSDIIFILYQIAEGMRYAHSLSIIHGDMNPTNIMISDDGTIKISDIGISMLANSDGTKGFIAPEISNNEKCNEKVDVFSFGSVIYFVLSGGSIPKIDYKNLYLGKKLSILNDFTQSASDLIYSCWKYNAEERSSFESIVLKLEEDGSNLIHLNESESLSLKSKIEQYKSKILSTKK